MPKFPLAVLAMGLLSGSAAGAQTLELRPANSVSGPLVAAVGDTVQIDLWARLDSLAASGIDVHLSLPSEALELVDQAPDLDGVQPFLDGEFFPNALVLDNGVSDLLGEAAGDRQYLRYAAANGPGELRGVNGEGRVATFQVAIRGQLDQAQLHIEDTPILETRLVLPDGTTERRFETLSDLELSTRPEQTAVGAGSWGQVKARP